MKRTVIALVLVAIICSVGFAEETDTSKIKYRITNGGFWTSGQDFCGGFGEFGINCLPEEKNFVLRDCIYCQGSGGTNFVEFGGDSRLPAGKNKQALKDFSRSSPVLTIGYRSMR
jgi:hypothetical protein